MNRDDLHYIIRAHGGWCVAKPAADLGANGERIWHRVSNLYRFRGWAENFARRMKIPTQNYKFVKS